MAFVSTVMRMLLSVSCKETKAAEWLSLQLPCNLLWIFQGRSGRRISKSMRCTMKRTENVSSQIPLLRTYAASLYMLCPRGIRNNGAKVVGPNTFARRFFYYGSSVINQGE